MTLRRLLFRGLVPLSVFAVLATLMVAHWMSRASDGQVDEEVSEGTPAVVRDRAVPVTPKTEREPAPPHTSEDDYEGEEGDAHAASDTVVAQLPPTKVAKFSLLGVTWRGGLVDADTTVEVRWRGDDGWSDWTELEADPTAEGNPGTDPYWVGNADAAAVRVLSTSDAAPRGLQLATIDPGKMPTVTQASALRTASGPVSQPTIISREAWGASNSGSCDSPVYGSSLRGAVIHHTAGSNTEPESRSAAIVKATQAYHMNSRDWCDIGYNFLVDRFGQIFEGRRGGIDKVVRGAHSGNGPVNEQTTGISLMGTFTSAAPPAAMKSAVVRLTAWKLALHGVPAKGTYSLGGKTLNRIAGHRDVVSTACPGTTVYAWLTSTSSTGLRQQAAEAMASGAGAEPAGPTGVAVTGQTVSSLSVDWATVSGAEGYKLKLSKSSSWTDPIYFDFTDSEGTATGLTPGTKYYVKVSMTDSNGTRSSAYSAKPYVTASTIDATPPTKVAVTGTASTSVSVDWAAVSGAEGYKVKLSKSLSWTDPMYFDFTDSEGTATGLTPGTKYYVKVALIDPLSGSRISSYSAKPYASGSTSAEPTSPPTKVVATPASSTSLSVDWAGVEGAERYRVKLSKSSSWTSPMYSDFKDSKGTVTGLASGTKYYVKVSLMDPTSGSRTSAYSAKPYATVSTLGSGSTASDKVTVSSTRNISVKGHGYGHGIGMGQYGAEGGARAGKSFTEILKKYYSGTALSTQSGSIRVLLSADTTDSVMVTGQSGLVFRKVSSGDPVNLPLTMGGDTVIRWNIIANPSNMKQSILRYRTDSTWKTYKSMTWTGDAQFEASKLTLILPTDKGVVYRTALRSAVPSSGSTTRNTVNVLSIENYTKGVVAREMPSSWHAEALKAQAVAARTYGVRDISTGGYYDLCDTTSCQVYGGVAAETSTTNDAVSDTAGKILTYNGSPAFTQFSSSSGGYTATGSQPYLKAVSDSWDDWAGNYNHDWTITITAAKVQSKYPAIGTLKSLEVTKRSGGGDWGGRVSTLKIVGSKSSVTVSGATARTAFGLKSTWFSFS